MPRLVQNIDDGYSFPLGIPYISSSMKKAGYKVITLNLNHRDGEIFNIIEKKIEENKIDVIATGGLSFQYTTIREVIEAAKQVDNKIITIVGGGIITSDPEPAMNALEYVDYGVIGEGEITISALCNALENGGDFAKINGLIYKGDNGYKITTPRQEIMDLDSLPWPDYKGFELDKYLLTSPSVSGVNRKNTVFMISSRSCPYDCTFCFHTVGKKYRQRSLDKFFEELEQMISGYNIDYVCLGDELFSVNPKRVKEFCEIIRPYNMKWWAQFRCDHITKNPELLPILKEAGCDVMSFGLESADNRILKSMKKHTTIEQAEEALKLVYDSGISMEGAFIFGDIAETYETANNTLKWWREHSEYRITLNLITVFPGSFLYKYACEKGIIKDKVRFLKDGCPQVNVSKLADKELSELVRHFMEAPVSLTKPLTSAALTCVDAKNGRIGLKGICTICGEENEWNHIKLFTMNFLPCKKCGQRYNVPFFPAIRKNIERNIKKLLEQYGKAAVWGINYHSSDLFNNSIVLQHIDIFPIDISETKRKMDLYGKKIYAPSTIDTEEIKAVVVAIPVYYTQIASQIEANHKTVEKVIDICMLTDADYGV